jgi:hypothetical protein
MSQFKGIDAHVPAEPANPVKYFSKAGTARLITRSDDGYFASPLEIGFDLELKRALKKTESLLKTERL